MAISIPSGWWALSRSSNQKRKRKARVATGVPCERPRRSQHAIINYYLDTPPVELSPSGAWFVAAIRNAQRIANREN